MPWIKSTLASSVIVPLAISCAVRPKLPDTLRERPSNLLTAPFLPNASGEMVVLRPMLTNETLISSDCVIDDVGISEHIINITFTGRWSDEREHGFPDVDQHGIALMKGFGNAESFLDIGTLAKSMIGKRVSISVYTPNGYHVRGVPIIDCFSSKVAIHLVDSK